jgi:hypothetical protein
VLCVIVVFLLLYSCCLALHKSQCCSNDVTEK